MTLVKRSLMAIVCAAAIGACDANMDDPASPFFEPSLDRAGITDRANGVLHWNETARGLVAQFRTDPPMATRVYALLSIAQERAVEAAHDAKLTNTGTRDAEIVAAAAAAAAVLGSVFATEAARLDNLARDAYEDESGKRRHTLDAAYDIGRTIAAEVLNEASTDGSTTTSPLTIPVGPGMWFSSVVPPAPPVRPFWGLVRTRFLQDGSELRPEPPPAFGSPAFLSALAEVRAYSDQRTAEQLRIVQFWADGPGTATPAGHWNQIAAGLIERHHLSPARATHVLATLNMAMMDAAIACWDAKYTYWLMRPSQADPLITTPVGLPNFPSYTSGHATFSGAAAAVLGHFFPSEHAELDAMAAEAALSRVYGGIHYRFDSDVGLRMGLEIGRRAVTRK